jgi:hypothetical protein
MSLKVQPATRLRERITLDDRSISVYYVVPRGTWNQNQVAYAKNIFDVHPTAFSSYVFDYRVGGRTRVVKGIHPCHPVNIREYRSFCSTDFKEHTDNYGQYFSIDGHIARLCPTYDYTSAYPSSNPLNTSTLADISRSDAWDSERAAYVLARAYEKVGQPDASLGLALAQFGQSVNLLRNAAERVVNACNWIKKMQKANAPILYQNRKYKHGIILYFGKPQKQVSALKAGKDLLRSATNNWLEYSFGLCPSIADFQDAQSIVEREMAQCILAQSKHARVVDTKNVSCMTTNSEFSNFSFMSYWKKTVQIQESYSAGVYYTLMNHVPMLYKHGLDPMNLPAIIWDAVPWSFVVDWFFHMSSWLNRIAMQDNIVYANNFVTHQRDVLSVYRSTDTSKSGTSLGACTSMFQEHSKKMERRTDFQPVINPQFTVAKFGFNRTCNALSLTIQQALNKMPAVMRAIKR